MPDARVTATKSTDVSASRAFIEGRDAHGRSTCVATESWAEVGADASGRRNSHAGPAQEVRRRQSVCKGAHDRQTRFAQLAVGTRGCTHRRNLAVRRKERSTQTPACRRGLLEVDSGQYRVQGCPTREMSADQTGRVSAMIIMTRPAQLTVRMARPAAIPAGHVTCLINGRLRRVELKLERTDSHARYGRSSHTRAG
jgi:hypothetical protein